MGNQEGSVQGAQYVYVILHRRNIDIRRAMDTFLTALGLQLLPNEASPRQKKGAPFLDEMFEATIVSAKAIIVLFTGDERVRLRQELRKKGKDQAPPKNDESKFVLRPGMDQIFEAGYALHRFPERTILIQIGEVTLFSDIDGRYVQKFTGKEDECRELIERLKEMKCALKGDGSEWHSNEDFQQAFSLNQSKRGKKGKGKFPPETSSEEEITGED